jgi:hypothetical protein
MPFHFPLFLLPGAEEQEEAMEALIVAKAIQSVSG